MSSPAKVQVRIAAAMTGALALAGCNVTSDIGGMFAGKRGNEEARATMPPPSAAYEATGSIGPRETASAPAPKPAAVQAATARSTPSRTVNSKPEAADDDEPVMAAPVLPGTDGKDDVRRGMEQFRAGNYAEAQSAFDRAAKLNPRDAEAWLGLAACYDRMRRFELADRAYVQASSIKGPTSEILNNQGYSYLLRGDLARARSLLQLAQKKDPGNKYVQNNLQLLASKERNAKAE